MAAPCGSRIELRSPHRSWRRIAEVRALESRPDWARTLESMPTDYHAKHWDSESREIDARQDDMIQRSERALHRDHPVEPRLVLRWGLR